MKRIRTERLDESLSMRFILPVMLENAVTIGVGLVFSGMISTISGSALAAIGIANQVMAVVFALFSMVTVGATVLVSRHVGAGEGMAAAETIEQTVLLTLLVTGAVAAAGIAGATVLMRLIMPDAEAQLFGEAVRYFRILLVTLPAYVLHGVLGSVSRALGDSRSPFRVAMIMNGVQLAAAWLFISVLGWDETGAGLSYGVCRVAGAALMLAVLLRDRRHFVLQPARMLRMQPGVFRRILRIGIPISVESVFVQVGYLVANSMAVSLGTYLCGVYQIVNTLNTFVTLPQGICATVALSAAGHLLGAGRPREARLGGRIIWVGGLAATAVLGGIMLLGGTAFTGLYTDDPTAAAAAAGLLWIPLVMDVAGLSINAIDSQLRAGGDVRFVMAVTLTAVWGIRLPLTWLFCFRMDMGVAGIFLANTVSLYFRAILGFARHCTDRWTVRKI